MPKQSDDKQWPYDNGLLRDKPLPPDAQESAAKVLAMLGQTKTYAFDLERGSDGKLTTVLRPKTMDSGTREPLLGGVVWLLTSGTGADGDEWQVHSIHASEEGAVRAKAEYEKLRTRPDGSTYSFAANIEKWVVAR